MGNAIDDTLCNIRQGARKKSLEPAYVPWGTVLTKVSKILYVKRLKDNVPLDERWAKGSRKAICAVSFVIIQVISGIKT
jgi:hypothetical protein